MERVFKNTAMADRNGAIGVDALLGFWAVLIVVFICISAMIILSCAEGASKDKDNTTTDSYVYGSSACVAAGCGAGCGG